MGSVYSTFAAVFGIGLVSRAFALAVVEPSSMAATLSARMRAMIGLELLLRGEFAAEIDALPHAAGWCSIPRWWAA